ncbi:MAG: histidine kinase dimerization/phospho-acceptor domain-containing protein [Hymenobacter sp.]
MAEEAVQARQVFMASMSHELRTPLHGIMGLAELPRSKGSLSDEQADSRGDDSVEHRESAGCYQ